MPSAAVAKSQYQTLKFSELDGWRKDDHRAALQTFLKSCGLIKNPEWAPLCKFAAKQRNARRFFEQFFTPVVVHPDERALFTGYYEPEMRGSLQRQGAFQYPIYRKPPQLRTGQPWLTRAQIEQGALSGQGLEIAWFDDPVDVFYLHIQGSGRVRLPDGSSMRVGFAAKNGHKYRSVAQEFARRGIMALSKASAGNIKRWVRGNPSVGREILHHNQSFIFFRVMSKLKEDDGPVGAMGLPLTTLRSVAVDPRFVPLGAPVWIEKTGKSPLKRLMVAQDVGSAIKGAQRADIFYGSGDDAGNQARQTKNTGRVIVLMPIDAAAKLVAGY